MYGLDDMKDTSQRSSQRATALRSNTEIKGHKPSDITKGHRSLREKSMPQHQAGIQTRHPIFQGHEVQGH